MGGRRVLVIGPSGAGKSTLARRVGSACGLKVVHLDGLANRHGGPRSAEFGSELRSVLAEDEWVIDGFYQESLRERVARADTVALLDTPSAVCAYRVARRAAARRLENGGGDAPPQSGMKLWQQLVWIVKYRLVVRRRVLDIVGSDADGKSVVRLRTADQMLAWLRELARDRGREPDRVPR